MRKFEWLPAIKIFMIFFSYYFLVLIQALAPKKCFLVLNKYTCEAQELGVLIVCYVTLIDLKHWVCVCDGLAESGNLSFLVLLLASIHLIKH